MLTNAPHSGPVSTIRVAGYVGLTLFLLLLIGCAIVAWRLIRAAQGTPFAPVSYCVGIGAIWAPFGFTFIFGDYKNNIVDTVLTTGFLNLLWRSLAAHRKTIEEAPTPLPPLKTVHSLAPLPIPALR